MGLSAVCCVPPRRPYPTLVHMRTPQDFITKEADDALVLIDFYSECGSAVRAQVMCVTALSRYLGG